MDGIVNVLKPPGMTSHDVVYFIRKVTGIKKCGHTGTLDPGAAGVLPLCLGKATRLARFVTEGDKTYRGELTLGINTTSMDAFGEKIDQKDASKIFPEQITELFGSLIGSMEQTPPMASAIKVNGKRLYQLERSGQSVEVPSRKITIYDLRMIASWGWQTPNPRVIFDVTCSKGTYVRTLCSDIGKALGSGAYMSFLLRSQVGSFSLEDSYTLEELSAFMESDQIKNAMIPMERAVNNLPIIEIHSTALKSINSGAVLFPAGISNRSREICENELVQVQYNQRLQGIYRAVAEHQERAERQIFKPEVVLSQ